MPLVLLDRLKRILPFANIVAEEIVGEETDLLEKIIPQMFNVIQKVAKFSCEYVKRGKQYWSPSLDLASADDHSANGGWAGLPGNNRRNR